jgi:hypothetical protein
MSSVPETSPPPPLSPTSGKIWFWRGPAILVFLAGLAFFAVNCWDLRDFLIDDAFITYRFGARLAQEGTLRWNLAPLPDGLDAATRQLLEQPVEGYTSFLSVLISAVFVFLRLDPLCAWKGLGILATLFSSGALVVGGNAFCRTLAPRTNRAWIPLLLAGLHLGHPLTALHAMSGMETGLHGALLMGMTALTFLIISDTQPRTGYFRALAIGFLLLGTTRPESLLWGALAGLGLLFALQERAHRWLLIRSTLLFFLLPGLFYFLWRWNYFHSFFPATFHAKAGGSTHPSDMGRLHTYLPSCWPVWHYLRDNWLGLGLLVEVAALIRMGLLWVDTRELGARKYWQCIWNPWVVTLVALFLGALLPILFFSHVYMLMGYGDRFLFPYGQTFLLVLLLPIFAFLEAIAQSGLQGSLIKHRVCVWVSTLLIVALIGVGLKTSVFVWVHNFGKNLSGPNFRRGGTYAVTIGNRRSVRDYEKVGHAVERIARRAERQLTLFHHNMGELFYYAPHWDTIDPVGLVDMPVAINGFRPDYTFARNPDLFILPSRDMREITEYNYIHDGVQIFPDISQTLYLDERMRPYRYLGYEPTLQFGEKGRMHFLIRQTLLDEFPEIENQLKQDLGLRIEPDFVWAR